MVLFMMCLLSTALNLLFGCLFVYDFLQLNSIQHSAVVISFFQSVASEVIPVKQSLFSPQTLEEGEVLTLTHENH